MTLRVRVFAALLLAAALQPAFAEMSAGEYQPGARRLTPAQRAEEEERIRQERQRAETVEREQAARAGQARLADEARLAARPLGVRLIESRCGVCHGPEFLRQHRYGWLGWWAVLLRMQYVNGASFEAGERRVIVAHLAANHSAGALRTALEWAAAATVLGLALIAGWRLRRRRG